MISHFAGVLAFAAADLPEDPLAVGALLVGPQRAGALAVGVEHLHPPRAIHRKLAVVLGLALEVVDARDDRAVLACSDTSSICQTCRPDVR